MATYLRADGAKIVTSGAKFTTWLNADHETYLGDPEATRDLSKWTDSAEAWLDRDIAEGYYPGFIKQPKEGN